MLSNGKVVKMPDKKLTDSEIIKALKEVLEIMLTMGDLQKSATTRKSLDLINRLQAENENYSKNNQQMTSDILKFYKELEQAKAENERLKPFEDKIAEFNSHIRVENMLVFANSLEEWLEFCDNLKAEAYKEFAERLKREKSYNECDITGYKYRVVQIEEIDNLLKELVG